MAGDYRGLFNRLVYGSGRGLSDSSKLPTLLCDPLGLLIRYSVIALVLVSREVRTEPPLANPAGMPQGHSLLILMFDLF